MVRLAQDTVNALSLGSLYALIALGVALIFGVMGFVNFAHGELIMIGGYILSYVAGQQGYAAVAITIIGVIAAAILMERIAFRPVRTAAPSTLLVTSFAVSFLLQNLAV